MNNEISQPLLLSPEAYFKGGSLFQALFPTPPNLLNNRIKDRGHDRVYLGVRTCKFFLAPTLPAKKKIYACDASPAPKVIWENLNHAVFANGVGSSPVSSSFS